MALETADMELEMEIDGGDHIVDEHGQDGPVGDPQNLAVPAPQQGGGQTLAGNAGGAVNGNGNGNGNGSVCHHTQPPHHTHTCFHPFHSGYSENNLPLVLFRLDPPDHHYTTDVGPLLENAEPVEDYGGRPIRDFAFLPRYISSRPPGWLLEYWMRTDNRLTYRDIKARMTGKVLPTDNVLNMRREREARMPLGLSCWTARRGEITKAEVERVERLTPDQVGFNTTMTVQYSEFPTGKVPAYLRSKSIKSSDSANFPLETFINGGPHLHTPSPRLASAIQLLFELQGVAWALGLDCWRELPGEKLPSTWVRRVNRKDKKTDSHEANAQTLNSKEGANGRALLAAPSHGGRSMQTVFAVNPDLSYTENGSTTTQSDAASWASSAFNTSATGTTTSPLDSSVNSPAIGVQYNSHIALAALSKIEPGQWTTSAGPTDQEKKPKEIPIDPRLVNYDVMAVDGGAGFTAHDIDPGMVELYRFNGAGPFSIKQNGSHRLNTNTPEIMQRNDPFANFRQPSISIQRSFEKYVMEDIADGNDTH